MTTGTDTTKITFDEDSLLLTIDAHGQIWQACAGEPAFVVNGENICFSQAGNISHRLIENGIGKGIYSEYDCFENLDIKFATYVWVENTTENVFFEWIPLKSGMVMDKLFWPAPMEFTSDSHYWYTLLNIGQGLLIPNDWPVELKKPPFDGFFNTEGSYMPWFAQVRSGAGYLAICETSWNAGYNAVHPENGPYTHVSFRHEPSLGYMNDRRVMRYTFFENCDYTSICKAYRRYVLEKGKLVTLKEKSIRAPKINSLVGSYFVHMGIKTNVHPKSDFYNPENPTENNSLVTFKQREEEMEKLGKLGVKKVYLHLDGWGQPGYDNCHPDYLPPCEEAGGSKAMKSLADKMHELGYMFGIHDQYRDYYFTAATYSEDYACRLPDGSIPSHSHWAGGPQTYLCATQAPFYVRRNYAELKRLGIELDGTYLDVFTCNEGDECTNPMHVMTRRECYDYRLECFNQLLADGIMTSSEEVSDWSIPALVFCHYGPYDFMLRNPGAPKYGIPVPLFNLVYHDCVIMPWMMEKTEYEDYMLYALINGGAPYLIRNGAYPDTDGSFDTGEGAGIRADIRRCEVVSKLHEKVAFSELLSHRLLNDDGKLQESVFADGTRVRINLIDNTYSIEEI